MPPSSRKRKTKATATIASSPIFQQRGIQAFGSVSKANVDRIHSGKRKAIEGQKSSELDINLVKPGGKRKRGSRSHFSDEGDDEHKETKSTISSQKQSSATPSIPASSVDTPRKRIRPIPTILETPTKGARSSLGSFSLQSSPPTSQSASSAQSRPDTPPTSPFCPRSPISNPTACDHLPDEVQDLIDLHASFLTALSLHYAHHGSSTPVDLRVLCPSVARAWRRRAVSVEDIQRILAVAQQGLGPGVGFLCLLDYGYGKICLEAAECSAQDFHKRLANTEVLNDTFRKNLEKQWTLDTASGSSSQLNETFPSTLPLLPIGTCTSLSKLTPLLAKGQRRLEDFKASAIRAQKSSSFSNPSSKQVESSARPKLPASRSDSLLSRIRAKEMVQSTLPPPPSAAMLERKSSLRRLEEVVPVLELLTSGTIKGIQPNQKPLVNPQLQMQNQSFTMPTLVQHLQMSLRNQISKDDAIRCIRLLAEIVPEWVCIRQIGKCIGVTIRRGGVGRDEMGSRVQNMIESL
ncbi:MAG: hypothetical protein HETSPECPRED_000679 [Heterodermia speciosa]|uniref:DNA replication factor Cdt1 C-terminal domain-containing protein n=1 Tax=Heterodermia speciosa TaxID=116794 RepID=A0A8H3G8L2_9LECA|nr:MAG: hypothetical protein HETSPECPRED_000679 [Heterodermia speciosa]